MPASDRDRISPTESAFLVLAHAHPVPRLNSEHYGACVSGGLCRDQQTVQQPGPLFCTEQSNADNKRLDREHGLSDPVVESLLARAGIGSAVWDFCSLVNQPDFFLDCACARGRGKGGMRNPEKKTG